MAREFYTAIDLKGNPLKGVPLPVDGTDAANKDYVDGNGLTGAEADALFLKPSEILAGANITVTESGDGTVTITGTGATADHTHPSTTDFQFNYDSSATMADPGSGKVRTDTAAGVPSNQIAFSDITNLGIDATQTFDSLAVGDMIYFQQLDNASNWGRYQISGAPVDNGTWWLLPVTGIEMHGAGVAKNQTVLCRFTYGTGGGGGGGAGGGTTILSGTATPDVAVGAVGDYYLDTDDRILYGPKGIGTGGSTASVHTSQTPVDSAAPLAGFELGLQITFAVAGNVTGLRYYRSAGTAQTARTMRLWTTPAGAQLATASSSAETGTGWFTLPITPVAVTAGQTFTVSFTSTGVGPRSQTALPIANGQLTASWGCSGTSGAFPGGTTYTDYWVDVVFATGSDPWPVALKSVPPGGAVSQVLAKTSATDYAVAWAPAGTGGGAPTRYVHTQALLASTWTITHGLGAHPSVAVEDAAGSVIYGTIQYLNDNTLTISFKSTCTGRASLI